LYLQGVQARQPRLLVLVLDDDERPPVLIERQGPQARHVCRTNETPEARNALYGLYMSGDNRTREERGEDATHFWKDLTMGGEEAAIPSGPGGTPNSFNNELQRLDSTRLVRNVGIVM